MNDTFIVEQKPFFNILSLIQPICSRRTPVETTAYILFQVSPREMVLKSTDLEISLQSSYPLKDTSLVAQRSFLVSGKRMFDLVKELEGDIQCTITNSQLLLQAGGVNLSLNIKEAQEFPPFPERIENLMQFSADQLIAMLSKVAFLIPQNNANPALNGLLLEINQQGCTMTATDGHCLAQVLCNNYTLTENKKWLLPRRAISEVKKLIESTQEKDIFLGICKNQLVFSGESFNFFTKLLADSFPQYAAILDKTDFVPAGIDRNHFIKTLRRSACLLSGQFIATRFDVNKNRVKVSMHNKDVGTLDEEIPLHDFDGGEMNIRFYAPYLLSGLQVFPDDTIKFYLKNTSKPIIFETDQNEYHVTYLVMPVAPTNG
jgi:DNA polymerase III subunit beta